MKKIAIISASVLALGAASVAADAGGSQFTSSLGFGIAATEPAVRVAADDLRGPRVRDGRTDREVRLIAGGAKLANTCAKANWPYYPSSCLEPASAESL